MGLNASGSLSPSLSIWTKQLEQTLHEFFFVLLTVQLLACKWLLGQSWVLCSLFSLSPSFLPVSILFCPLACKSTRKMAKNHELHRVSLIPVYS